MKMTEITIPAAVACMAACIVILSFVLWRQIKKHRQYVHLSEANVEKIKQESELSKQRIRESCDAEKQALQEKCNAQIDAMRIQCAKEIRQAQEYIEGRKEIFSQMDERTLLVNAALSLEAYGQRLNRLENTFTDKQITERLDNVGKLISDKLDEFSRTMQDNLDSLNIDSIIDPIQESIDQLLDTCDVTSTLNNILEHASGLEYSIRNVVSDVDDIKRSMNRIESDVDDIKGSVNSIGF